MARQQIAIGAGRNRTRTGKLVALGRARNGCDGMD
jgi:hypothetical protein